jgi:hypothetical protein
MLILTSVLFYSATFETFFLSNIIGVSCCDFSSQLELECFMSCCSIINHKSDIKGFIRVDFRISKRILEFTIAFFGKKTFVNALEFLYKVGNP